MSKLLETLKEQYFWEAQRRDKLNSSSAIPIGFATTTSSLMLYTISDISFPYNISDILIVMTSFIYIIIAIMFFYNAVRFFLGPIYKYVASADKIRKYNIESRDFFENNPNEGDSHSDFIDYLENTYATCATVNCENNDRKSNTLYNLNKYVLIMLACSFVTGTILIISKSYSVYIGSSHIMSEDNKKPSPPPPPQRPAERSVKDGANVKPIKTK